MAATTTLLGLLTPTQGTLSGTWGDSVNYGISDYLDIAIAGTLSFAGDGAITLANTTGSASGNGIGSTTAQYMVIRITGTQTVTKVITGPSYSKLYMVDHAGATSAVTFKAAGQTGVTVAVGEKCFVYYNGTDYVKIATSTAGTGDVVGPASATANGIALFNSTTGKLIKDSAASDGLIHGLTVGRGAGAVSTNTVLGSGALAANTTGSLNTAVGISTLASNTTGAQQVAIGRIALRDNTTGTENTAVGAGALALNISGNYNTACGSALNANTTGSNNVAIGYSTLQANTTADYNTVVGFQGAYYNTTGTNNAVLGVNGLLYNTTGSQNTAIGRDALFANTTASNNTAVGYQAAYSNTTGAQSTYIGNQAGYGATTGTYNAFLGYASGVNITTGSKNTIIGSYNGNQGGLDIRTASNYIVLSDGDGNPRLYNNATDWYDSVGKLRAVPQSGSAKTTSYTLATTDVGEYILLGASGAIVIPDATFAAGDVITIFNNTASTATITCSITTAYIAGTFTDKATMTLAAAGVATVLFITSTLCVVSGNVT